MEINNLPPDSFLAILLNVVETQIPELLPELFSGTKEELTKAYNDGVEAGKKKYPQVSNPYPVGSGAVFSSQMAWDEGWLSIQLNNVQMFKDL
jgi:hypothetical protein